MIAATLNRMNAGSIRSDPFIFTHDRRHRWIFNAS